MDRQDRVGGNRRNYNSGHGGQNYSSGGGGRAYYQGRRDREYSRGGGNSGNNAHGNDLDYNSSFNSNPCFPTWRNLVKRHADLIAERARALRDLDVRQLEAEKIELFRLIEDLRNGRQDGNNNGKASDAQEDHGKKDVPVDTGNDEKHEKSTPAASSTSSCDIVGGNRVQHSVSGAVGGADGTVLEQSSKGKQNISPFEMERNDLNEKFTGKERKLDMEFQRFCTDIERKMYEMDKRNSFDPILARNKILEREIIKCQQTLQQLQDMYADLRETNRGLNDRMQQMNAEFNFQRMQLMQDLETERRKVKSETAAHYLQGGGPMWAAQFDPLIGGDILHQINPSLGLLGPSPYMNMMQQHGAINGHHNLHQNQPPALQPMPSPTGDGILSDLRDRYEDIKVKADESDWVLPMIRKVVRYYEEQGVRVCEEALANKFVSTLIWSAEDTLFPDKYDAAFAMGHGNTGEEATANAVQQAYHMIIGQEKEDQELLMQGNDVGDGDKYTHQNTMEHGPSAPTPTPKGKGHTTYLPCRPSKSHPMIHNNKQRQLSSSSSGCGISIRTRTSSMQSASADEEQAAKSKVPEASLPMPMPTPTSEDDLSKNNDDNATVSTEQL